MGLLKTYCTVHIWLFFIFWIHANLFRAFSGRRCPIFKCFDTFDLSFHQLSNTVFQIVYYENSRSYREKKTESRKLCLSFSSFFGFMQTYFAISQAVGVRFLNVLISLYSSLHQLSNAIFQIVLLQKLAKLLRKQDTKLKTMARGGGV